MSHNQQILFLNRCYPPELGATGMVLRQMAYHLSQDFSVTILVGRPALPAGNRTPFVWLDRQNESHVVVERVGTTAFEHYSMIGRIFNYVTYFLLAMLRALTLRTRPTVIVTMSDPPLTCVIGAIVAKLRGCAFIYSIQDLHPDMAVAAGMVKSGWLVSLWNSIHVWATRQADVVIVLGKDMRERIVGKGVNPERVIVIRHGARSIQVPVSNGNPLAKKIRAEFPFVVLYSGNLGWAGAWEVLIQAASRLVGEGVRFVFVGEGTLRSKLEEMASELPNVYFQNFFPQVDYPYVLSAGDLHIVTVRSGLAGLVAPSKLYPLLKAGRPILAVAPIESDVTELVTQYQCGLFADPTNPDAVVRAVLFARDHPAELKAMGQRAAAAGRRFSQEKMSSEFSQVVKKLVGD